MTGRTFKRGDRVETRTGRKGTVRSVAAFGRKVYVMPDDTREERAYDPTSLTLDENIEARRTT